MKLDSFRLLPRIEGDRFNLFDAGDIRVNENAILTSYHTIFAREHNRMCNEILKISPLMSDEEVFQTARNYVVGLLQKITMDDFLPILIGKKVFSDLIG